ncbi:hypothetical protein D3C77_219690 [compost metagenome]
MIDKSAIVKWSFDDTVDYLRFGLYGAEFSSSIIKFYDDIGLVDQQELPFGVIEIPFEYTSPVGRNIRWVEITASHLEGLFGIYDVSWRYADIAIR